MHLVVDFRCTNHKLMRDQNALAEWMLDMADKIGMTAFGEPTIVDYPFPSRVGTALSATLFLGESSIVVHTYPEFGHIFLDVFSCKSFDEFATMAYIDLSWGRIGKRQAIVLQRGIDIETGEPLLLRVTNVDGVV